MSENKILNCVIIGSGPAGYTAAIYASRANLSPVLFSGMQPGGQLTTTTEVDNFPGYPEGIDGNALMEDLKKQAQRFGAEINFGVVTKVDFADKKGGIHTIEVDGEKVIKAKTVIVSTGASARYLGLESEEKLKGGGVSACATCDGFFYRGKDVVVVGGGDSAIEEAVYLSNICSKIYLLVRKNEFRASKIMQQRVLKVNNIKVMFNTQVQEVLGENVVTGVRSVNNITNKTEDLKVDGMFVAIGHKPNTEIFKGKLELDDSKYIITKPKSTETNISGVFACGDVQDTKYRQAITAAGTGCMAALDAEKYLSE